MKRSLRLGVWGILLILGSVLSFFHLQSTVQADGEGQTVYVIPVKDTVERGMAAFLNRTTEEARENGVDHIIFEIDTPGGRVDAAGDIGEIFQDLDVPNSAFVTNRAYSAGSYIALNADAIYMKQTATMGASGVINSDGTAADKKAQSAWISSMVAAAESTGRDPIYARAMADSSVDLKDYGAPEGEFLTLGATDAEEVGYAEGIVDDRNELLSVLGLSDATVIEENPTLSENIARFLTDPVVIPILLSVASIGLVVELYSPGFGIPGTMGALSLVLFFYGHIVAGLAGYEAIILLVLGIGLVIAEFFLPGGIAGIAGVVAIVSSLMLSSADMGHMAMSIGIALLVTIVVSIVLFKFVGLERGFFRHIILNDSTSSEKGYVSSQNRLDLIGMEGEAITPLRPSGTADFDGERLDVVSEGGFISVHQAVKIIKTEGSRIVVREVKKAEKEEETK
ncbi:NfeD family protein [Halobacillus sp. SY10]|uniref:Membrane-bound serine protease (ClpP class) n=2 Tax=Halobacillus TaxID=45667 RepID=A0A1H0TPJ4_HALAD|nr:MULTISPECIES: nodulation protein NfeD [Halobacillus]RDY71999.1 nodulation protein NfeD [Halobacillus trueperi]SDP55967.1 membrane-bound serine protease (ClpP class) [Halobacillus aidingensis]